MYPIRIKSSSTQFSDHAKILNSLWCLLETNSKRRFNSSWSVKLLTLPPIFTQFN